MMIITKLRGALKSATMWVNGLLLAAYPFIEPAFIGARDNFPGLEPYLPADLYKWAGLAIVIFNIYLRTRTTKSLAEKGSP